VSGKVPELWHPDTGAIERAPVYSEKDGVTTVPLRFDPSGSVFVVFRRPSDGDHAVSMRVVVKEAPPAKGPIPELTILKAEYGAFGGTTDTRQRGRHRAGETGGQRRQPPRCGEQ
jgi:hypothetical protein